MGGKYDFTFDWMPLVVRGLSLRQRINMLRAGLNLGYRRLRPWGWPLHMQIELTSYCNLRCPVCPVGTGELTRGPLAIDVPLFDRLLEEVGPYLLTLSLWAWGEPLLHPNLEQLLAVTRRYPVATLLSTNGQNLNRQRVQEALRREPPFYLIVAIDGLSDETNSVYRKGAKLQPALEGVRALAEWKEKTQSRLPVLHCRFLAMKHNEHELPRLREFAAENQFDMFSVRSLSVIDSSETPHQALLPETNALRAYEYEGGAANGAMTSFASTPSPFPLSLPMAPSLPANRISMVATLTGLFPGRLRLPIYGSVPKRLRSAGPSGRTLNSTAFVGTVLTLIVPQVVAAFMGISCARFISRPVALVH